MYDLGDNFKIDLNNCLQNSECVFKGNKYRITVLTERLVRLEYSDNGVFNDNLTYLVQNRNFERPDFTVEQNNEVLKISTRYFNLTYLKEKAFIGNKVQPTKNLRIGLVGTDKVWYYGHPEARNYGYFVGQNNKLNKLKSLYSMDGFATLDDSNSLIILPNGLVQKKPQKDIDIYVFMYNKDFYYCLSDYFKLTGYPNMIPKYALGTILTKNTSFDQYSLLNFIQKYLDHNIPISSFILKNWESNNLFEINSNYKEIDKLAKYLSDKNVKFGLFISDNMLLPQNTNNYDLLTKYLNKDKNGNIPINLLDARCVDAYLKLLIHPLNSKGVSFYSIDGKNNNIISLLKYYLYKDNSNNRSFSITPNTFDAPHKYSIIHSGESEVNWESLKNIVKINSTSSNYGLSFISHDFGGSKDGIEDAELYSRFMQLGTFSPIFRLGSDTSKYYKREPWKWDIATSEIASYYINLRYRLIPYLYTECYKYYKYGKPIIEPIYYRHPEMYDDYLYNDNYFFGSTFYVSPIIEKKNNIMDRVIHKIFIPDGVWYDYFTGKKYNGNKRYVSFYKVSEYPVFVKTGAIIPMSVGMKNDLSVPPSLEIQVFPGDNNTYSIYEDDGYTNNYLNGEYAITNIEYLYKENNYTLTILPTQGKLSVLPSKRNYLIRFKNTKPTAQVKAYTSSNELNVKKSKKGSDLLIEIKDVPTSEQFTITCTGENIEIENKKIIGDDVVSIISDLPIKTVVKEKIDSIIFSDKYDLKKKRIEIRKLANGKNYLQRKYIDLFLNLLEYINEV